MYMCCTMYMHVLHSITKVTQAFEKVYNLSHTELIFCAFVVQLQQQGILKSDDLITRFFRISVEMCVDLCYRTINDPVSDLPTALHTCKNYKSATGDFCV